MCTLILLRRADHEWPLIMAANRDEMIDRPWLPPGRHWPDWPDVVAGKDLLAGGSWMGMNTHGVMAAMLNRRGTLGPAEGKRSRGELVLEALDYADAVDAAQMLAEIDARAYRPFNMVIADNRDVYWLRADGQTMRVIPLEDDGLFMLTAFELNDPHDPRIAYFLPRWRSIDFPEPDQNNWKAWENMLGEAAPPEARHPETGMCFLRNDGFGTQSSSLVALPAIGRFGIKPVWTFCEAPPRPGRFTPVTLF